MGVARGSIDSGQERFLVVISLFEGIGETRSHAVAKKVAAHAILITAYRSVVVHIIEDVTGPIKDMTAPIFFSNRSLVSCVIPRPSPSWEYRK